MKLRYAISITISLLLISNAFSYGSVPLTGNRILVLAEDKVAFKPYTDQLSSFGFDVTAKSHKTRVDLFKHGEPNFEHLILILPTGGAMGGIKVKDVLHFIDMGGNAIIASSSEGGNRIKTLFSKFSVQIHTETSISCSSPVVAEHIDACPIISQKLSLGLSGAALAISEQDGSRIPIVWAPPNCYLDDNSLSGRKINSVVGVQGYTHNQRVLLMGNHELLLEEEFAKQVSLWALQRQGTLRFSEISHKLVSRNHGMECDRRYDAECLEPGWEISEFGHLQQVYNVGDKVQLRAVIEQLTASGWVPLDTDIGLQYEFSMLHPYIRRDLPMISPGIFQVDFQIPDQYGVFKFRIDDLRLGYSRLYAEIAVPVTPLKHYQFERFIFQAFPYYIAVASMLVMAALLPVIVGYGWLEKRVNKLD